MRWAIKHKSGRILFVTTDEFIANNRKKMGWIVEQVRMTSREQFEAWFSDNFDKPYYSDNEREDLKVYTFLAWRASRAAIEIETPDFIDSRAALNKGYTVDYSNGFGDAMDAYELAIEQAGLKVKK